MNPSKIPLIGSIDISILVNIKWLHLTNSKTSCYGVSPSHTRSYLLSTIWVKSDTLKEPLCHIITNSISYFLVTHYNGLFCNFMALFRSYSYCHLYSFIRLLYLWHNFSFNMRCIKRYLINNNFFLLTKQQLVFFL